MSPNDIEFLLHCHTSPIVHPRIDAPAVQGARDLWLQLKCIVSVNGKEYFTTTRLGKAHVQQICNLELPMQAWVGSDGEIIQL